MVDEPADANLGEKHSVRMAEDAKWYFVKDNRAANSKEYKGKMLTQQP